MQKFAKLGDENGISSLEECAQPSSIELLSRLKKYKLWIEEGYNLTTVGTKWIITRFSNFMYNVHACLLFNFWLHSLEQNT